MSSPNQLSFLPEDYLETKRKRRTNVIGAALFLVIKCSIVVAFVLIEKSLRKAESENQEINKQYVEAATRIEQDAQMQEKQRRMASQAELTASLLEKVPRSVLLAELTNSKPPGISFLDLTLDSKIRQQSSVSNGNGKTQFELKRAAMEASGPTKGPVTATPAKLYDVTVKVTGVADNDVQVAQFMAKLNHSKLVRDVNLVISDEFTFNDAKMRKFQIEMMIDPNAEVQPGVLSPKTAGMNLELK